MFAHFTMGDTRTPAHIGLSVEPFLTKNSMTPIPHPPYSPDLSPRDFFLFVSLGEKIPQKEMFCQFGRGETKKRQTLKGIKISEFKNGFEQWKKTSR